MYAKYGLAPWFSLPASEALGSKITDHRVCKQTYLTVKVPISYLHQNSAWITGAVSHHGDISTMRGMNQIQIGAFRAMDWRTGIHTLPFDTASKSQSFLLQSKDRIQILISPWYGYVPAWRRLAQTQSSCLQVQRKSTITGVLNLYGYRDFQINKSVAPKSHPNEPYFLILVWKHSQCES